MKQIWDAGELSNHWPLMFEESNKHSQWAGA